jgi:UDP-glucose 4-epimerase
MLNEPRIIVFGGCGYVGRTFVREALRRGRSVLVCDLEKRTLPEGATFANVDIRDAKAVAAQITPGSSVVNFAGIADLNKASHLPLAAIEVNVVGNINILEACRAASVAKYSFASTAYVYSLHGSFYRISKRTCEEYILEYSRRFGLPYLIFRYGSLYGADSDESNGVHRMVKSAMTEGRIRYAGAFSDSREYIHVNDAARMSADLVFGEAVNQAYLLTGNERITVQQFIEMLSEIIDKPVHMECTDGTDNNHYRMTQYNFAPIEAKKISPQEHIDIGTGLLDLIQRIHLEHNAETHHDLLVAPLETEVDM